MSTHKHIDKICCVAIVLALILTVVFMNGESLGIVSAGKKMGYENRLFSTDKVHTIDIVMNDWDGFIETCENEEYAACSVIIDGENYGNVGIRAKGNTSLSSVSQMNSDRYSFKLEFDQYEKAKSYHGLDKISLNNVIQDNTYMKDFLTYQMMNEFGVAAPLCSFVYITVNGEAFGLYLAVEGVEEGFLQRNYGKDYGELYKPDSMSFGGGRGNGKDFDISEFKNEDGEFDFSKIENGDFDFSQFGGNMPTPPDGFDFSQSKENRDERPTGGFNPFGGEMPDMSQIPEGFDPSSGEIPEGFDMSKMPDMGNMGGFGGFGGMGGSDVKLQYSDDNFDSYKNIFNNAKTDITDADKTRLIESLKTLSSGENIESVVDIEQVIKYFVVHNFVVNGDSYTGAMIHNYYLYEKDGVMSMLPWDYNLAFGTFMSSDASSTINGSIDSPVSSSMDDRPMISWIFNSEEYTNLYHKYFSEFISEYFESGKFEKFIDKTIDMISPYVEKDPTKFCTYDEFLLGSSTIKNFCLLRAESVSNQLDGTNEKVDASAINISDMGTMGGGGKGGMPDFGGERPQSGSQSGPSQEIKPEVTKPAEETTLPQSEGTTKPAEIPDLPQMNGGTPDFGGQLPEGFDPSQLPEGFDPSQMPDDFSGQLPEGFDPSQLPEGFDPSQMPSMNGGMPDFGGQMPGNGGFPANPPSGQNPFGSGMPPMFN